MRRYRVQEFLSIWEDFKSKHKNKKIWWAFSESKMTQYISSLIYGLGKKIFHKLTPAKKPFPQWLVPFVRLLWAEDDWKKYINYKYCSFLLSSWETNFFRPSTWGSNLHAQLWEISWNDCAPAFGETERKLSCRVMYHMQIEGSKEHNSWHAKSILEIFREHWSGGIQNIHQACKSALCNLGNLNWSMNENGFWRNS